MTKRGPCIRLLGVRTVVDKISYLWLRAEEMSAFVVPINIFSHTAEMEPIMRLRLIAQLKTEMQNEIIEIQINEMQERKNHRKTNIFSLLAKKLVCSQLIGN